MQDLQERLLVLERNIEELRRRRTAWVSENTEFIYSCRDVVRNFGTDVRDEFPYPHNTAPVWRFWAGNSINILLTQQVGEWSPRKGDYKIAQRMVIKAGDYRVCYYQFTEYGIDNLDIDELFVPGNWMEVLHPYFPKTRINEMQRMIEEKQKQYDQIKNEMLVGVEL